MRLAAQATGALALTALAAMLALRLSALIAPLARTDYLKLPPAPPAVNGAAYPASRTVPTVVLVVLEGADEADVRALPALKRVWLDSRYVPHVAPDAQTGSFLACLLSGMDLGTYMYQPVSRFLTRPDLRALLGDADALVARVAANGIPVHVHGYRLLQDLLAPTLARRVLASTDFADADPAQSPARLDHMIRAGSGPVPGFHLVEVALPPRSGRGLRDPRDMSRGSPMDQIDDALDRVRRSLQGPYLLAVAGTDATDELSSELPVVFISKTITKGEQEPRPLQDLPATLCMALGAARPARAIGIPDVDLFTAEEHKVSIIQKVVRDRSMIVDAISRTYFNEPIALPIKELEQAAAAFLANKGPQARKQLDDVIDGEDARLAALRRDALAKAARTGIVIPPRLITALGAVALTLGLLACPAPAALIAGLVALALATVIGARLQLPLLAFDPYGVTADDLPRLFRAGGTALAPVVLLFLVLDVLAHARPALTLLSLANVSGGLAALKLAQFLETTGFVPTTASPGTLNVRVALVAALVLATSPVLVWPGAALAALLGRLNPAKHT